MIELIVNNYMEQISLSCENGRDDRVCDECVEIARAYFSKNGGRDKKEAYND